MLSDLETFANNYSSSLLQQILEILDIEIEYCLDCRFNEFCLKHHDLILEKMREFEVDEE